MVLAILHILRVSDQCIQLHCPHHVHMCTQNSQLSFQLPIYPHPPTLTPAHTTPPHTTPPFSQESFSGGDLSIDPDIVKALNTAEEAFLGFDSSADGYISKVYMCLPPGRPACYNPHRAHAGSGGWCVCGKGGGGRAATWCLLVILPAFTHPPHFWQVGKLKCTLGHLLGLMAHVRVPVCVQEELGGMMQEAHSNGRQAPGSVVSQRFAELDIDGDGKIGFIEFLFAVEGWEGEGEGFAVEGWEGEGEGRETAK